jgi:hypothetical protein
MIFLAIDEMQNAECRTQNEAGKDLPWLQPHSACCLPDSALRQRQMEREADEERLKQAHLQAGHE